MTLQDGQPVPRRFSAPAFGFPEDSITMIPSGGANYICSTTLGYDDRLNPFKHLYHPNHDNLDSRFEKRLAPGTESFSVTRQIQLQFALTDPASLTLAGWGDTQVGGIYSETITGLHKDALYIAGTFRLQRVSTVGALEASNTVRGP